MKELISTALASKKVIGGIIVGAVVVGLGIAVKTFERQWSEENDQEMTEGTETYEKDHFTQE